MSKIWNTPLNKPLRNSRLVRRIIIDYNLNAGWPVKWGGQWDICINGKMVPTGLRSLDWTGQNWIDFINKNQKMKTKTSLCNELISIEVEGINYNFPVFVMYKNDTTIDIFNKIAEQFAVGILKMTNEGKKCISTELFVIFCNSMFSEHVEVFTQEQFEQNILPHLVKDANKQKLFENLETIINDDKEKDKPLKVLHLIRDYVISKFDEELENTNKRDVEKISNLLLSKSLIYSTL